MIGAVLRKMDDALYRFVAATALVTLATQALADTFRSTGAFETAFNAFGVIFSLWAAYRIARYGTEPRK